MFPGVTDYSDDRSKLPMSDIDRKPYTTLTYGNGPGYMAAHCDETNGDCWEVGRKYVTNEQAREYGRELSWRTFDRKL